MQSRFHSGWKALVLVAAIAALALLPVTGANAAGVGLWEGLGFRTHHDHRYVAPGGSHP